MDFDRRLSEPMDYAGIRAGINQSNQLEYQDSQNFSAISQINNANMDNWRKTVEAQADKSIEELKGRASEMKEARNEAIAKVGEYGTAIGERYGEYKDFINSGGDVSKLRSARLGKTVGGVMGRAGDGVKSAVQSINEPAKPTEFEMEDMSKPANNPSKPPVENTEPVPEEPVETPSEPSVKLSGQVEKTGEQAGEEAGEIASNVSKFGKVAKGVGRVGGGLFAGGMLASDIYQQKQKGFFYGDNTGDKVGNFLNEIGSVADLGGVATGDPLLALAGVGIGAVGSVVSDISELFGHHKKAPPPPPPPPKPTAIVQPTAVNLAGSTGVVQGQASTLRGIEQGA
jgi:hypothetical protein